MLGVRMRSRKQRIGLAALLALATAVPALAQPSSGGTDDFPQCSKQVTSEDSEAAHNAYLAGKASYDTSKYGAAITKFREAYARDCTKHELLVILSRSYELNHDLPNAIKALQTYTQRVPNAPDKKTYEDRIKSLQQQLQEQKAQPSATPSASATPPPTASSSAPPPPNPPPPQGEVREHTIWPWVVVVVGGMGMVTGAIFLIATPDRPPNCDVSTQKCTKQPPTETDSDLQNDQTRAGNHVTFPKIGAGFLIVGGALVGGGLLWHFLEPTGPASGKPSVTPAFGPGYAGASLGASF